MVLYVLCQFPFPLLSVILPLYSFYNMDSFSWGATRVVMNDGKVSEEVNEEDVDYSQIKRKSLSDDPRISLSPLSLPSLAHPSPIQYPFSNQFQQSPINYYGMQQQASTPRLHTPQPYYAVPHVYQQESQFR
jgi:chitin synthase